ncbi:hypothetical protein [Methylomonas koyamae]|uniref:hypothetical protein n=1 Tax=Methylomonas koyamae TaxID=702114 RepID=UPI0006CF5747|nr:hypothetical protein [Methylomonas koyamae]
MTTEAFIGAGATVKAADDVLVDARAAENYLLIGVAVGGGIAGIGGAVTVPVINDTTNAYIGNGASVVAGGDVAVTSRDDTKIWPCPGPAASVWPESARRSA